MVKIGFLHTRKNPNRITRLYAFAAVAKAEGVDFFYFTAGRVNLVDETINAWVYENGSWIEKKVPFPDVIYNDSYPGSKRGSKVIETLCERIPFTSYSVGDKMTVYEKIEQAGEFNQYLIPSVEVRHPEDVFPFLNLYKQVTFKPVWGHKGIGVVRLELIDHKVLLTENNIVNPLDQKQFHAFLQNRLQDNVHLIQPFIVSQTKSGNVFDFRLHVQKNGIGKWVITSVYPRIGVQGSIIANLSSGGYTNFLISFLQQEFGVEYYDVKRYLEQFALALAKHMDDIYDESFDELGIDVGLDNNHKIWLFEINWKPGTPVTFNLEMDVAKNSILYAKFLAKQKHLEKYTSTKFKRG